MNNGLFYVAREVIPSSTKKGEGENEQAQHLEHTLSRSTSTSTSNSSSASAQPSSRVVGVSMWLPPHPPSEPESWYSYLQSWLLSFRQLITNIRFLGHGGLRVNRYWIWKAGQEKAQRDTWTDSRGYYFCNVVAVLPGMHGRGIGRKLVEVVTDQADREGMKCYLESSKDVPNIQIYERMGFKLERDMDCDDNGTICKLYCMTRDPKPLKS